MRILALAVAASVTLTSGVALAQDDGGSTFGDDFWGRTLAYFPSRLADVADVFRIRLRAGPGGAVSARATQEASLNRLNYNSYYLGVPGPRKRVSPRWPIGPEKIGPEDSPLDFETGPNYGENEFGLGIHLFLGVDLGFDPDEFVDAVVGIFLQDPQADDF